MSAPRSASVTASIAIAERQKGEHLVGAPAARQPFVKPEMRVRTRH